MEQEIRFLQTPHGRVAFATVGHGPPLMLGCWWLGHLELQWESTTFRPWIERLAATHAVIRYDRPGIGLSSRGETEVDAAAEASISAAVLEASGLGPAVFLGASSAGCAAVALAATRPDLVTRLVLYGAYANGRALASDGVGTPLAALVEAHWGLGSEFLADIFMPDAGAEARDDFVRFQRRAATARQAAEAFEVAFRLSGEAWLTQVAVPTLVVHRRGDRAVPVELGRDLAARIPGARFVSLPGRDHLPWVGDVGGTLRAIQAFVGPGAAPEGTASTRTCRFPSGSARSCPSSPWVSRTPRSRRSSSSAPTRCTATWQTCVASWGSPRAPPRSRRRRAAAGCDRRALQGLPAAPHARVTPRRARGGGRAPRGAGARRSRRAPRRSCRRRCAGAARHGSSHCDSSAGCPRPAT